MSVHSQYVKIEKKPDGYQVILSVGVQSFEVGPRYDTSAEATWYRKMLIKALDAMQTTPAA